VLQYIYYYKREKLLSHFILSHTAKIISILSVKPVDKQFLLVSRKLKHTIYWKKRKKNEEKKQQILSVNQYFYQILWLKNVQ